VTLTFDLLTLKVVSESRVTSATSVPILVFLLPRPLYYYYKCTDYSDASQSCRGTLFSA